MNTTPEALQLLNFCEINRHTGLASDLRKAMGIEANPVSEDTGYVAAKEKIFTQRKGLMARLAASEREIRADIAADHAPLPGLVASEQADNYPPGFCEDNWIWPNGTPAEQANEVAMALASKGTKLAAEIREPGNKMTKEEREEALAHGMRLIYGGLPETDAIGPVYQRTKYGELFKVWSEGGAVFTELMPQHKFIWSNGTERKEPSCV